MEWNIEKLKLILLIGGAIFWSMLAAAALVYSTAYIYHLCKRIKFRTWIYQVWEYFRFRNKLKKWKEDFSTWDYSNWQVMKIHRAKFEGRVKGMEYRQRALFKKYYIRVFDQIINDPVFDKFKKEQ
jgi:hypothetical protein